MVSLARAADHLTEHGARSLVREAATLVARRAIYLRWRVNGSAEVSVGGVSARFVTRNLRECQLVHKLPQREDGMIDEFVAELREDDVVFDVGSHMGLYTCLAAAASPHGRVVAFEPYDRMRRHLETNVALNDTDAIRVEQVALGDEDGTAAFDNPGLPESEWSGTATLAPHGSERSIEVETARGDRLVSAGDLPTPDVVKIDVEGAEPLVIEGLHETLRDEVRTVFLELHRPGVDSRRSVADFDTSPDCVRGRLRDLGFSITDLADRGFDVLLKARK